MHILIDARGEQQFHPMRSINLKGFVQVSQLVCYFVGSMNPNAFSRPHPADDWQESVTALVQNPNPHGFVWEGSRRFAQAVAQIRAELLGRLRVFFHMVFTRNFQLASQATDGFSNSSFGERFSGPLLDRLLDDGRVVWKPDGSTLEFTGLPESLKRV